MAVPFKANEKCIVRHQDCKRIFGGSRTCFIACPNSDEIALELDVIKQKLREANIEPYIAVDERDFQKDIFCEKICTKIIESLFCITILNDVADKIDGKRKPNANVYYEYGLMTAFRKKIIPVQLSTQALAFNIQSLDTLKYSPKDFSSRIEEAIKMMLLSIDEDKNKDDNTAEETNFEWMLDLKGLIKAEGQYRFRYDRVLSNKSLGFEPYLRPKDGRLFYAGIFGPDNNPKDILIRAKMLNLRIQNYCNQIRNDIEEMQPSEGERIRPMNFERISEMEKIIERFSAATILIIKADLLNADKFKASFAKLTEDIELKLDLDVLDTQCMRELLEM